MINAIEHGNEEEYDLQVKVKVYIWEVSIVIQVKDQGSGFNWQPELDKEIDLNNFSECGRGLAIAEQAFDYVGWDITKPGIKLYYIKEGNLGFQGKLRRKNAGKNYTIKKLMVKG